MNIPIRFPLFRRQPSAEHLCVFHLTRPKLWNPERPPKLRLGDSFLSSEQNCDPDEHKANNNHRCPRDPAISPGILRPFLSNPEEQNEQKKIGDAQREMWLGKNEKWNCRRQTRHKDQQETGKCAVKVVFHHAWPRDPRLRHVIKNGSAESFTLLGIQQRLKFRLDFVLNDVKGCARVASMLNRLDQ